MRRLFGLTVLFVLATAVPAVAGTPPTLTIGPTPTVATSGDAVTVQGTIPSDAAGNLSVDISRSTDGVTFSAIANSPADVDPQTFKFSVADVTPSVSVPTIVTYEVSWAGDAGAGGSYDPGTADSSGTPLTVLPASTLTVDAQVDHANVGDDVTVAGVLQDPSNVEGASIVVERSVDGGSFTAVTNSPATTDAGGAFSVQDVVDVPGSYTYRASWAGDGSTHGAASATGATTVTVRYATTLTITKSAGTIVYGQQVTINGAWGSTGTPAVKHVSIERHRTGGGTVDLSATLSVHNRYRYVDTPGAAGTFTYTATWGGDATHFPATSTSVHVKVTKRATTLALDVTHAKITYGHATTLIATLRHGDPASKVRFEKKVGTSWQAIGSADVAKDRTARLRVSPGAEQTYRAVFDATDGLKASTSGTVTVRVRPIMTGHMAGTFTTVGRYAVYNCCTSYFFTKLKPIHPHASWAATVQYYGNGRWRTLGSGSYRFEADGDSAIFLNASSGYRYRVRGHFDGDADHLPATSSWSYFRFVK
jgi:hypothetical protein